MMKMLHERVIKTHGKWQSMAMGTSPSVSKSDSSAVGFNWYIGTVWG